MKFIDPVWGYEESSLTVLYSSVVFIAELRGPHEVESVLVASAYLNADKFLNSLID